LEDRQHKETRYTDHQPGNARAKERTSKRALPRPKPTDQQPKEDKTIMNRKIAYLDKAQAKAVVQIFRRGQLGDLAVFLKIDSKNKNGQYQLCIDCPEDTHPRLASKLQDVSDTLVEAHKQAIESMTWQEYNDKDVEPENETLKDFVDMLGSYDQ
jgi:hypothetical protein|tara:strand:+ start:835 stop:1299 length:465 start_codon:yes stop_codon:yes gene_type:complete